VVSSERSSSSLLLLLLPSSTKDKISGVSLTRGSQRLACGGIMAWWCRKEAWWGLYTGGLIGGLLWVRERERSEWYN